MTQPPMDQDPADFSQQPTPDGSAQWLPAPQHPAPDQSTPHLHAPQMPAPQHPAPQMPQPSTKAIIAVVLGVLGLVACPLIGSIAGLILSYSAQHEIEGSNGWITGREYVTVGKWLGWIGIAYAAFFALILMFAFALPVLFLPFAGGTNASGHQTQPCDQSAWHQQAITELNALTPGSTDRGADSISFDECWSKGGGEIDADVSVAGSYQAYEEAFPANAKKQGWTKLANTDCFTKPVADLPTYLYVASSNNTDAATSIAFSTDLNC